MSTEPRRGLLDTSAVIIPVSKEEIAEYADDFAGLDSAVTVVELS